MSRRAVRFSQLEGPRGPKARGSLKRWQLVLTRTPISAKIPAYVQLLIAERWRLTADG